MKLGSEFADECLGRLNAVVHVGVDTSNKRFSSFADWFVAGRQVRHRRVPESDRAKMSRRVPSGRERAR